MFSNSVRRAALAVKPTSAIVSSAPRAVSTQALSCRPLQRRYSSSKPSSPADGSKPVVDVAATPRTENGKSKKQRRKAKDAAPKSDLTSNLPSVPSTGHLQGKEVAASAFFSLHRPISVTSPFPRTVTDEAFASIFTTRTRSQRVSDVLSTLSGTVRALESADEVDQLRAAIQGQQGEVHHLDGLPQDSDLPFPNHILSGQYQPFQPPPPPVPMNTLESLSAGKEAAESQNEVSHRTYTATLTIEESTDANGEVTYVAHSGPLVDIENAMEETPERQSFLERMSIRQRDHAERRMEEESERGIMQAISVRRQRKLKMKKHKYKKLMRKTRNLRRRLDRN